MKAKPLSLNLANYWLLLLLAGLFLSSCTDECESTITYTINEPVYMKKSDLRSGAKVEGPRPLRKPGKIYSYGDYLFVNEQLEGIHIIDNSSPSSPQNISFLALPGNVDLAVKDHTLYADSYIDLVVLDITNPRGVQLVNRVEAVFPIHGIRDNPNTDSFLAKFEEKLVTQPFSSDCDGNNQRVGGWFSTDSRGGTQALSANRNAPGSGGTGKGGSMARFTITGDHLYTVNINSLQLFDITDQALPTKGNNIQLGWGIETIFPYQDKLFIGSTTGMHIFDNSNPNQPVRLSTYAHVNSCDPVVVDGDLAWVTLRSGNACTGITNQLDLVNISNPRNPYLVKTYPMQNPHGLGIDRSTLFLCEGAFGLKVFDASNALRVTDNQLKHIKNIHAYDVIPLGTILLMVGNDGLYQYDYTLPSQMKLISKIPVTPAGS